MREQHVSSTVVDYIAHSLGFTVLLILGSFLSALFHVMDMALALVYFGGMALIYGMVQFGISAPADAGITAVNDMRGQAGGNPLANYANRQEYKLAKLREEHPSQETDFGQDTGLPDEPKRATSSREADARNAACWVIAGLLALGLSFFAGQMFPR